MKLHQLWMKVNFNVIYFLNSQISKNYFFVAGHKNLKLIPTGDEGASKVR